MRLHSLETRDFRNLAAVSIELPSRLTVFSGSNAQGKTNLLEAAHLAVCQRPFRAARTQELLRFGAASARVRATVEVRGLRSEIQVLLDGERKKITVDGKVMRGSSASLASGLAAVLFTPDDLQVPRGSPAERRRLLDRAVATVWEGYTTLLRDYVRVLRSRNKVLRERPARVSELLDVYDRQLAALGAKTMLARERYLRSLQPAFSAAFARIMGTGPEATLRYQPAGALAGVSGELAQRVESFARALQESRSRDLERRSTNLGPHADDLELAIDGRLARLYASQGQTRALVLAFRIAQILDTYDKLQHYPLLLLDDVSSELDPEKNAHLFDFISEISCQVLLTTTRPELVPLREKRIDFKVLNGAVQLL